MYIIDLRMYRKEAPILTISFDLSVSHSVVAANSHFYEKPTEPLYLNRTLQYHDLIYLCDGNWTITESEIDYNLTRDDVLLLSAGHHHYTRLPCAPKTQTYCIHVTHEAGDLLESDAAIALPVCMNVHAHPEVRDIFTAIVSTFWSEKRHKNERMTTLFNHLVLSLLDIYESSVQSENDLSTQIISLVNRIPHRRFNTKEIADMFHVCTKTVDSVMVKKTGFSFAKYQTSRKLEMVATQLLVEPDIKLSEIASSFGFYDEFHLSRAFKQKYEVSPTQFKKLQTSK